MTKISSFIRPLMLGSVFLTSLVLGAQAQENLRITIPVPAFNYYPVFAAHDLGYFDDEGIDMEIVVTQGDGPDVDALISGSVQFAATTPNRLLTAYQEGRPLLGVMNITNRIAINCFMNSDTADRVGVTEDTPIDEKFAALEDLVIGGTRPGAFTYILAIDYLNRAGLVPQEDAQVIGVGGGPAMLAAVENGQIDMGCIASPTPEIAVSRGSAMMFMNNAQGWDEAYSEFLFALLYVRPEYAQENPETVERTVRALQRAITFILDAPFEEQEEMLRANFGDVDEDILRESLANTQAALEPNGFISEAAFDAAVDFLISTDMLREPVPFNAVIDTTYLAD